MAARKGSDPSQHFITVRVAPLGTLDAFTVFEHELDLIAAGSPATLAFNFAVALISIGLSFALTISTTKIESERLFYGYLIVCVVFLLVGTIMLAYWVKTRSAVDLTVAKIKRRLIVATPMTEQLPGGPT